VFGHGFHPLKARHPQSIPNLQDVHRQGRTPMLILNFTAFDPIAAVATSPVFAARKMKYVTEPFTRL
jgi:hypothetical protein